MSNSIYHFDRLTLFDKWTIGIYLLLTAGLLWYFTTIETNATRQTLVFGYAIITQLALYGICYKSLRNMTVLTFWTLIGLLHLYFYFQLKDDLTLQMLRGHAARPLRNTIPLLFVHQILRLFSFRIQHKELVVPSRGFNSDIFNERKVNWLDFLFFIFYVGCVIVLD